MLNYQRVVPTRAPYELLHYDTGYPLEVSTLRKRDIHEKILFCRLTHHKILLKGGIYHILSYIIIDHNGIMIGFQVTLCLVSLYFFLSLVVIGLTLVHYLYIYISLSHLAWWTRETKLSSLPSGNLLHSYWKSPFFMGKSTINSHFQ